MRYIKTSWPLWLLLSQNLLIFKDHYFNDFGFPWDFSMGYYALVAFWTTAVSKGIFPQWIPFQQMGFPFAMQTQSGIYYAPLWLFPVLHIPYTLNAAVIVQGIHVLAGSIGMFLLLRRILKSTSLALVGAIAFQFFGGFYSNSEHPDIVRAYAFSPWVLYFFTLDYEDNLNLNKRIWFIPLAMYFLATGGYPGNLISTLFITGLYVLLELVEAYRKRWRLDQLLMPAALLAGLTALGLAMAAVQLGPAWITRDQLVRTGQFESLQRATLWFGQLPGLFLSNRTLPGEISMTSTYVTLPVLILASFTPWSKLKQHWIQLCIGALGFLMAAGENSLVWTALTSVLPPLKLSRFPTSDYRVFLAISIILFALLGLKAVTNKELGWQSMVGRSAFTLTWFSLGVYFAYPKLMNRYVLLAVLVALTTLLLLAFFWARQLRESSRIVWVSVILLVFIDGARVLPDMNTWRDPNTSNLYSRNKWPYERDGQLMANLIFANLPSRRPSRLPSLPQDQLSWGGYIDGRYMMGDMGPGLLQLVPLANSHELYQEYMQMEWLPLFVDPGLVINSSNQVSLSDGDLAGYLETWKDRPLDKVEQTFYGINDINYQVSLDEPRLMMENETYFPGWEARLIYPSGEMRVQAISVNSIFRAWLLPAGNYQMAAHFEFPNIWLYRSTSLASFIVWLVVLAVFWKRRARIPARVI